MMLSLMMMMMTTLLKNNESVSKTLLPDHVMKGIQDVMALFSSRCAANPTADDQPDKHWINSKLMALASLGDYNDNDDNHEGAADFDVAVSDEVLHEPMCSSQSCLR